MRTLRGRLGSLSLCLALAIVQCSGRGLPKALEAELKCGMSASAVSEIVQRSGATMVTNDRVTPMYGTHTAGLGRDRLWLMFADDRLLWIRSGRQAGWTGMRVGPKVDLCNGEKQISLIVHGDSRWSGAVVTVDEKLVGVLSGGLTPGIQLDIPFRRCRVVVTKGSAVYSKDIGGDRAGRIQIDLPRR